MIPALLALGAIVGGYLVVTNWQEIEGWLLAERLSAETSNRAQGNWHCRLCR